jgi:hypothetical protein
VEINKNVSRGREKFSTIIVRNVRLSLGDGTLYSVPKKKTRVGGYNGSLSHKSLSGCMAEVTLASETLRCRVSMAHAEETVTAMPTTIIKVLFLF